MRGLPKIAFLLCVLSTLVVNLWWDAAQAAPRSKRRRGGTSAASSAQRKRPAEIKLKGVEETAEATSAPAATAPPPSRGPTRIDFDDRLIQGQTNRSGAVYLYDRKELKTRSMIKKRESFREEIVGSVYDG